MTPTEQDNELREAIKHLLGYCMPNQHQCTFEASRNETQELDEIMQLITADRKRVALEARIDEAGRIIDRELGLDYGEETEKYLSVRIAELKAQQEEV